jgi:ADP-ribose pyrophosphatase
MGGGLLVCRVVNLHRITRESVRRVGDRESVRLERVRKTVYSGRILKLHVDDDHWEIVEHQSAVAIVATRGEEMLLVRQRRPAVNAFTLEIPAGLIEAGEEPLAAAAREFAEECGLAGDLRLLTRMYVSPGFTDELVHLVRAQNLREAHGVPDEDEDIEVTYLTPRALIEGARDGSLLTSAPAIAAAYYLLLNAES